jgi:hypothetical protein
MKRSTFFKSLLTLIVAPKAIAEINWDKLAAENVAAILPNANATLFNDLQLLTPHYYKQFIEKYGNENYSYWLNEMAAIQQSNTIV